MPTYQDLMSQARDLMEQAEAMRRSERAEAITDIKNRMAEFQISASELESILKGNSKIAKSEPKYRGPNNELWSGGRGRKPEWVKEVLGSGKNIEDFRI
jgi:DNA-binding protein H-NS